MDSEADDRLSLFLVMFLAGWNDASQGPLLPSLQEYYNVNYTISACTSPMMTRQKLTISIDNLGSELWRIRCSRYFQCLVD
jgi:hypothetical protein